MNLFQDAGKMDMTWCCTGQDSNILEEWKHNNFSLWMSTQPAAWLLDSGLLEL